MQTNTLKIVSSNGTRLKHDAKMTLHKNFCNLKYLLLAVNLLNANHSAVSSEWLLS